MKSIFIHTLKITCLAAVIFLAAAPAPSFAQRGESLVPVACEWKEWWPAMQGLWGGYEGYCEITYFTGQVSQDTYIPDAQACAAFCIARWTYF